MTNNHTSQTSLEKFVYLFCGVLLPIIAFYLSFDKSFVSIAEWQSGRFHDYVSLILYGKVNFYFFPLLCYSITCFVLVLFWSEKFTRYFLIRLGIYMGVFLSFQFILIEDISLGGPLWYRSVWTLWAIGVGIILVTLLLNLLGKKIKEKKPDYIITYWFLIALLVVLIPFFSNFRPNQPLTKNITQFGFGALIFSLFFAPIWCFYVYLKMSLRIYKTISKVSVSQKIIVPTIWIGGLAGSWTLSVLKAIEVYKTLPKTAPDCYLCTAVAKASPQITKAKLVPTLSRNYFWLNHQIQIFKTFEIMLMTTFPRLHFLIRKIYDWIGPLLGQMLTFRFVAHLVYRGLKPLEFLIDRALKKWAPKIEKEVKLIYRKN